MGSHRKAVHSWMWFEHSSMWWWVYDTLVFLCWVRFVFWYGWFLFLRVFLVLGWVCITLSCILQFVVLVFGSGWVCLVGCVVLFLGCFADLVCGVKVWEFLLWVKLVGILIKWVSMSFLCMWVFHDMVYAFYLLTNGASSVWSFSSGVSRLSGDRVEWLLLQLLVLWYFE